MQGFRPAQYLRPAASTTSTPAPAPEPEPDFAYLELDGARLTLDDASLYLE